MKRIALIVIRLFWKAPYYFYNLKKYHNVEKYSINERWGFIRKFLSDVARAGRVEIVCTGLDLLPEEDGYLMAPNHQGLFDPVIIAVTHVRPTTAIIKKELLKAPIVKDIAIIDQAQALDRDDVRGSVRIIKQVTKELTEGRTYFIFPEGTRSRNGNQLQEFKGGTFKTAVGAKKPIVPVCCIDSYKPFDTNSIAKITAQVHYLKPIYPEEYEGLSTVDIAKIVQERIQAKMDEVLGE